MTTRKDYQKLARLIGQLSFYFKDGCFELKPDKRDRLASIDTSHRFGAKFYKEVVEGIDRDLKELNENYDSEKFWNAVYKYREDILDIIFN